MTNKAYAIIGGLTSYPIAGLIDSFGGSSLSGSWSAANSGAGFSAALSSGQLQCTLAGSTGWAGVYSAATYDMTNASAQVQVTGVGGASSGNMSLALELVVSQSGPGLEGRLAWCVSNNTISVQYGDSTYTQVNQGSWSTDSASYAYLRIRSASSILYWDSSADGVTWTNRYSTALSNWTHSSSIGSLYAYLYGDNWGGVAASNVTFANFALGTPGPAATATAVVVSSSSGDVTSGPFSVVAPFSYGDSEEKVRQSVVSVVQAAAGSALDVSILSV